MIKSHKESKSYKYAIGVTTGKIVASRFIIKQAERYLNDLKRSDLCFDLDWHKKVSVFFENICYVPELSAPVELPLPHAFWIEQIHCLRYKKSKKRKYKQAYIQVARKQAKTFYAAVNALFELILGEDNKPEIMCGANSRDQAVLCTKMMGDLITCSPELKELKAEKKLTVFTWQKEVTGVHYDNDNGRVGKIEAMPKDPGDGGNPSVTVVDELHEAKDLKLLETMKSGQGLRRNPLALIITSPGHNKDAPCYSILRDTAVKILEGSIDNDNFLPILFELDNEEDWDKIDELVKSNPMMEYMDTLEDFLKDRIQEAKDIGGETEVNIKIKNSGIWVDAATTWIQSEIVKANNHDIKPDELVGKDCYLGIDLAKAEDLNACALLFPNVRPNIHAVKMMYWIPSDKVNNNRDHVDYTKWIQQGFMIKQDGNVADHYLISQDIITEIKKYNVKAIGFDSRFAYAGIIPALAHAGYEEILSPVGQGYSGLSSAVVQMFNWMKRSEMDLMHNQVLYWNLANVVMKIGDEGDQIPSKGKSSMKIDGVSATLTAIAEYLRKGAEPQGSFGFAILN